MAINSEVRNNQNILEYGKFVEIVNDSNFPPLTTVRSEYKDSGTLYTETHVYPKYALLTYDINSAQVNGSPFGDNSSVDAFGKLRVSQPSTLLDSKLIYGKQSFTYDEVLSGIAVSYHVPNDSCVVMSTSAANDFAIRQTRARFNYQPGKSMQYMFTGLFKPEPNIIKRVGAFQSLSSVPYEPSDGIYLEVLSSGPVFVIRKTQGTVHTEYAPQSAWNIDRLDGTGPSGLTINLNYTQLFVFDYEWLSVGRVRFGFYINGKLYYCHSDSHAQELTAPYMTFSNQPVRYEIRQIGPGSGSMKQICSTVLSEGGEDDVGTLTTAAVTGTGITVSDTVLTPVLGIRCTPGNINLVNAIKNIEIYNSTSRGMIYQLLYNPTISPAVTWQTIDDGILQQTTGGTGFTISNPGYILVSNYCSPNNKGGLSQADIAKVLGRIGASISGTPDTLFLAAKFLDNSGSAANIYAAFNILMRA